MIKHLQSNSPPCVLMLAGLVGCSTLALPAFGEETNGATVLKPTVVTGSYIPTADTVGPAPVQTIDSTAIQTAGTADPLQTLKKLVPSFTGSGNYLGSVNNNVNLGAGYQAFSGESYASLRNLPTLVLIDGQRVPTTALSGAQAVDLNSIPISMIERVEVLKDGASAIYGSDAIGGVINIITKKNWSGLEIGGRVGFPVEGPSNHGLEYQAYLVGGTTTENARFVAGAQYYHRNPLLTPDRDFASLSAEQLAAKNIVAPAYVSPSFPGRVQSGDVSFVLAGSPFAEGHANFNPLITTPPSPGAPNVGGIPYVPGTYNTVQDYIAAHPGVYIPIFETPAGQLLTASGQGGPEPDPNVPGGFLWAMLDTTAYGTVSLLEQDRRQFWANFDYDIFKNTLNLYSRFLYSDNLAFGALAPSPVPSLSTSAIGIPANNPYNPFGIALGVNGASTPRVRSRFVDFGNREFFTFSDFFQWVGGLKGDITPNYHYDLSFDYGQDRQEQQTRNAVNGGGLAKALVPLIDDGNFVLDDMGRPLSELVGSSGNNLPVYNMFTSPLEPGSGLNAAETINALRATLFTWGQSELWNAQGVFNGTPFDLPAGKLQFAAGGQYIHEAISLEVDGLTKLGLVPGLNAAQEFPGGQRNTAAGFVEVNIPVLGPDQDVPAIHSLELNAAGRYQTFDPGGDALVPKLSARWQPLDDQFTLRGGYGEGFIAPSIFTLFGPDFISNPNVTINNIPGQVQTQTRANPDLPPQDSQQWNVGIVITPHKLIKNLTISVDYYNVELEDVPIADAQGAATSLNNLGSGSPFAPGFTFSDGTMLTTTTPNQVNVGNWGNLILPWQPAGGTKVEGIDFAANYVLPVDPIYGRFIFDAVANLTLSHELSTGEGRPFHEYAGTFTTIQGLIPDYNLTTSFTYEYGGWGFNIAAHYLPETEDPGGLHPEYGLDEHGFTVDGTSWTIDAYFTIDLQLSYEFGKGRLEGRRWFDGTRLAVGCLNVTGEDPPLIPDAVEDNTDKNNYDILGQFVYFEVSKKF